MLVKSYPLLLFNNKQDYGVFLTWFIIFRTFTIID